MPGPELPRKPPCSCLSAPHHHCQWGEPEEWDKLNLANVPAEPGFYVFTDHDQQLRSTSSDGRVLYVGESKNLQRRMRQYKVKGVSAFAFRGAVNLLSSQGVSAGYTADGRFEIQQHGPLHATVYRNGQAPEQVRSTIFVRWAVDPRKAIEQYLIRELGPLYNSIHAEE